MPDPTGHRPRREGVDPVAQARKNLAAGGLIDLVEFRGGDALHTLSVGLPDTIDLLLMTKTFKSKGCDRSRALYARLPT